MANPKNVAKPPAGGMNVGVAVIGFVLCFMAGSGLMWAYSEHNKGKGDIAADSSKDGNRASGETANWNDDDSPVPVSSKDPVWGKRDAPVTVVIFSDFQCPYCSKVEGALNQVKTTYGPDKVRMVWKNQPLPFHQAAKPAAEAAQGVFALAGSEAFWKFHDEAFKNQSALNPENYEKWAQAAGVKDMKKFKDGLASHTWADKVDKDMAVAKAANVQGTPHFLVNGFAVSGAQPFEAFKKAIDAELGKAEAKIKLGTARDKVYVEMTKENKKNAPPPAAEEDDEKDDPAVWKVPVGTSPIKGAPNALVTIIEFSDFECPFCSRVGPTMAKIMETYPGKVRIVWKNQPLPFHSKAKPAANLALEARAQKGDKGFWDAHDKLFANQKDLSEETLWKVAEELGLNVDKAKAAVKEDKYKASIETDQDVADDFQAGGTPHFFINGKRLSGAQPFEKFQKVIDEELKKATEVAKTAPADKLYETIVKDGKAAPEPEKKNIPPAPATAPWKGKKDAKVTLTIFSDFQCPYCSRVEPTINEVIKNYGDKVKVVWRDLPLPFHADAPLAAEAAREAFKQKGPEGFWKMHDKMFENQKEGIKRENLEKYAKDVGLDVDKFKAALDSREHKAVVEADAKAAGDAGIQGTPAMVINGYFVNGAQGYPKFRRLIERALAEAK